MSGKFSQMISLFVKNYFQVLWWLSHLYCYRFVPLLLCTNIALYCYCFVLLLLCTIIALYRNPFVPLSLCTVIPLYRYPFVPLSLCTVIAFGILEQLLLLLVTALGILESLSLLKATRGLYFGPKMVFISPPPLLKMIFFPPLETCHFSTPIVAFLS